MQYEALLRGVNFRPIEAKVKVNELVEGQALLLEREPYNEFDSNAIKVIEPDSQIFLGYVAKEVAADLAPEMDSGKAFTCKTQMKMPAKTGFQWVLEINEAEKPGFVDEDVGSQILAPGADEDTDLREWKDD